MAASAPRGPEGRPQRRAALAAKLLTAVERLLAEGEGFAELSVDRLVAEAGVGRSTFYKYFDDKGDLLREWFDRLSDEVVDASGAWLALDGAAAREDVTAALRRVIGAYRPHVPLLATVADAAAYDAAVAEVMDAWVDAREGDLQEHIERGQGEGWVDADVLPGPTARWLVWLAERGQQQLVAEADDDEVDALTAAFADIVWHTLYAYAPSRARSAKAARRTARSGRSRSRRPSRSA